MAVDEQLLAEDAGDGPPMRAFFDGLTPRLEAARQLDAALDVALARRFNAFDFLNTSELGLSSIVAELLDVNGRHGQGALFLTILLNKLRQMDEAQQPNVGRSVLQSDVESSIVKVEFTTKERRRIDVFVSLGDGCLALENKPYAGDEPRQVHDYLLWLNERYENFRLIYLSPQSDPPSESSVTLDELREYGTNDRFKIMAYADCQPWEDEYDEFRLEYSLADWFADCQRDCSVDRLRWFLREAELFCRHRFGGDFVTDNEHNAMMEFVLNRREYMKAAAVVHQCWPDIKKKVVCAFYDALWEAETLWGEALDDTWYYNWDYSGGQRSRYGCYWFMYKESWRSRIQIRLANDSQGPNGWIIGIFSPVALSEDDERRQNYKKLADALDAEIEHRVDFHDHWPWWIRIDEKYRNWDSIIPALNDERNEPGEITKYFVEKLVAIANAVTRDIDEFEA